MIRPKVRARSLISGCSLSEGYKLIAGVILFIVLRQMSNCLYCGCKIVIKKDEGQKRYEGRRFCSHACASRGHKIDPWIRIRCHVEIDPNTGCWNWMGAIMGGYGSVAIGDGKSIGAHRLTYFLKTGVMSTRDNELHHRCENKRCCNANHVELLTRDVHVHRSPRTVNFINKNKTHCVHGHEFTKENTKIEIDTRKRKSRMRRRCKQCLENRNIQRREMPV